MASDPNPQEPRATKYARIHEDLLSSIATGEYPIGANLPPERTLAKRHDVSVATVRQALSLLERAGMVSREQGRGTIVRRREPMLDSAGNSRRKGFAYVFVERDSPTQNRNDADFERSQSEMRRLDRMISARDSHLLFTQTTTKQLAEGRLPKALDRDLTSGVFLSGNVSDLDAYILREKGLSAVVLGSQNVSVAVSRVFADIEQAAFLVTQSLIASGARDVLFISEPFTCETTRQSFTGYCRAASESGKRRTSIVLSGTGEDSLELRSAVGKVESSSAILLVNVSVFAAMDVYRELGIDLTKNPTAVLGYSGALPDNVARKLNVCSDGSEASCEEAVKLMDQMLSTGRTRTIVLKPRLENSIEDGRLVLDLQWEIETALPGEPEAEEPLGTAQPWWLPKPSRNP